MFLKWCFNFTPNIMDRWIDLSIMFVFGLTEKCGRNGYMPMEVFRKRYN